MAGLFPCDWNDPVPLKGRKNKEGGDLFDLCSDAAMRESRGEASKVPEGKVDGEEVVMREDGLIEFDPGGLRTQKALEECGLLRYLADTSSNYDGGVSSISGDGVKKGGIPEDEKCEGEFDLPEFLKDPRFGISQGDTVEKVSADIDESDWEFLILLKSIVYNFNLILDTLEGRDIESEMVDVSSKIIMTGFLKNTFTVIGDIKDRVNVLFKDNGSYGVKRIRDILCRREAIVFNDLNRFMDYSNDSVINREEVLGIFVSIRDDFKEISDLVRSVLEKNVTSGK